LPSSIESFYDKWVGVEKKKSFDNIEIKGGPGSGN
jgi:hypothetical protein